MKCPYCGHLGDKVVDSRESKEGEVIRRRRECLDCGKRFTSYERIDEIPYMVVKKDGSRERFERQKLIGGLLKACEKRPVSVAALEGDRRPRRGDAAGAAREGDRDGRHRRVRDGGAQEARQGRLRPLRVGLPPLPRHRRVHERAEGPAERRRSRAATMPATVTPLTPRRASRPAAPPTPAPARTPVPRQPAPDPRRHRRARRGAGRRCWRWRNRTPRFSPDFLTEFVLYALSAADLTMLVALVFVLARNIVKLIVERRRALPFARFRAKLVALLLGMTLVPAVLVLIVGSELIRTSVDRWFNAPMDEILVVGEPDRRATTTTSGRCWSATTPAASRARSPASIWRSADVRPIRDLLAPEVTLRRVQMVRGLPRRAGGRRAAEPRAGRRRRGADAAARLQPRGGRSARGAGARRRRPRRASIETLGAVGRSAARGRGHPRDATAGRPASSSRPTT